MRRNTSSRYLKAPPSRKETTFAAVQIISHVSKFSRGSIMRLFITSAPRSAPRRRRAPCPSMSALPPKADMCSATRRVRFVPIADIALFDHLVGGGEQLRMEFEAERFGGLEVDHQLEFGGPHDRQIGRLLALENPPGVNARLPIGIHNAGPVAHQAASRGSFAIVVDRRQRMARRQRNQPFRLENKNAPTPTMRAPAPRCTNVAKAVSISRSLLTSKMTSCCPIACAAACTSLRSSSVSTVARVHEHGN